MGGSTHKPDAAGDGVAGVAKVTPDDIAGDSRPEAARRPQKAGEAARKVKVGVNSDLGDPI